MCVCALIQMAFDVSVVVRALGRDLLLLARSWLFLLFRVLKLDVNLNFVGCSIPGVLWLFALLRAVMFWVGREEKG